MLKIQPKVLLVVVVIALVIAALNLCLYGSIKVTKSMFGKLGEE